MLPRKNLGLHRGNDQQIIRVELKARSRARPGIQEIKTASQDPLQVLRNGKESGVKGTDNAWSATRTA